MGGIQTISYLVLDVNGSSKKYPIDDHLIVGSEKGPIKLTGSTLSARHASLFSQEGVVSIMDHRSEYGTFLNGTKLVPGKMYVVLDEDEIKFGELSAKLASGVKEVLPDLPPGVTPNLDLPDDEAAILEDNIATSSISIKDVGTNAELEFNIGQAEQTKVGSSESAPPLPGVKDLSELRSEVTLSGISRVDGEFPDEGTKEMNVNDLLKESKEGLPNNQAQKRAEDLFKGNEESNLKADDRSGLIDWNEKTSILKRFKDRFMNKKEDEEESLSPKKTRVKVPKQKKVKVERSFQTANALLRIFALLIDIIITYIFFDSIKLSLESAGFFKLLEQEFMTSFTTLLESYILNIPVLGSWIDVGSNAILTVLKAVIIFFLMRMIGSLIFGVSLGQFCLGMRGLGTGLGKRFKGFFRELIGAATTWVIILDLPTIFSKRSFKEALTGSMVCSAPALTSGLLIGIFLPFWIMMAMVLPLFENFESSPSYDAANLTSSGPTNSREAITEPSKYFMMGIPENKDPFWMVPAINIKIASGKKILSPIIYFYHPELKEEVKWTIYKRVDMTSAISEAFKKNPLADKSFPMLANILKNEAIGTNLYQNMTEEEMLQVRLELIDFLNESLKVTASNLMNHVADFGPFVNSYVAMKKYLIRVMDFDKPTFEFIYIGDKVFLRAFDRRGGIEFNHFLPVELGETQLYQSSYKSGKMKIAFNKFSKNFTFKPDLALEPKPNLAWIDKLSDNAEDITPNMLAMIEYFKNEGKRSFEEENFDYLALLEKALKQNYQGYQKLKGEIPEELDIKFQELLLSFKDRNRFYFTGEEKSYNPQDKPENKEEKKEISIEKAEEELFGE